VPLSVSHGVLGAPREKGVLGGSPVSCDVLGDPPLTPGCWGSLSCPQGAGCPSLTCAVLGTPLLKSGCSGPHCSPWDAQCPSLSPLGCWGPPSCPGGAGETSLQLPRSRGSGCAQGGGVWPPARQQEGAPQGCGAVEAGSPRPSHRHPPSPAGQFPGGRQPLPPEGQLQPLQSGLELPGGERGPLHPPGLLPCPVPREPPAPPGLLPHIAF